MTELETLLTRLHAHGYPAWVNGETLHIPFTEDPNGTTLAIGPVGDNLAYCDWFPVIEDHPYDGYVDWVENHAAWCDGCSLYAEITRTLEDRMDEAHPGSSRLVLWPEWAEVLLLPALTELARIAASVVHGAGNPARSRMVDH